MAFKFILFIFASSFKSFSYIYIYLYIYNFDANSSWFYNNWEQCDDEQQTFSSKWGGELELDKFNWDTGSVCNK